MGTPKAQKNSARSFESGAPPEKTSRSFPPVPARIFEYTSLLATAHCNCNPGLAVPAPERHEAARLATVIAQSKILRFAPVALPPCSINREYSFSKKRGTAAIIVGRTSANACGTEWPLQPK